jgi:hypothetical protein
MESYFLNIFYDLSFKIVAKKIQIDKKNLNLMKNGLLFSLFNIVIIKKTDLRLMDFPLKFPLFRKIYINYF